MHCVPCLYSGVTYSKWVALFAPKTVLIMQYQAWVFKLQTLSIFLENDGIWINRNKAGVFQTTTVQLHVPIAVPPLEVITAWIELAGRLVASEGLLEASRRLTIRGLRFSCTLYAVWVNSRRATVWEKWITARTQKMYATAHAWGKAINRWWIKGSYLIHRQYKTVYRFIHLEFEQVHIRHTFNCLIICQYHPLSAFYADESYSTCWKYLQIRSYQAGIRTCLST